MGYQTNIRENAPQGIRVRHCSIKRNRNTGLPEKYFGIARTVELQEDIYLWKKEQSRSPLQPDLSSMYRREVVATEISSRIYPADVK